MPEPKSISGLKIASLGSGSKGNATLIQSEQACIMVDCGFTLKETELRCQKLGFDLASLSAILVTHEHQDHIKGSGPLSRKYQVPIYSSQGTFLSGKFGQPYEYFKIKPYQDFELGDLTIIPFNVPHDAREPCQFVIQVADRRLAILSDLGKITEPIVELLATCQGILLEMNHDYEMLMNGPYPYQLKQRVGGSLGHLNNQQSLDLLAQLDLSQLSLVVATHLSEQNNCPNLVKRQLNDVFADSAVEYHVADQTEGLYWLDFS